MSYVNYVSYGKGTPVVNRYRNGIVTLIMVITDVGIMRNSEVLVELTYLLAERIALPRIEPVSPDFY